MHVLAQALRHGRVAAVALHHDEKGDYNRARAGYLAALRADPRHADARHDLALLCWRQGVEEEARHHAETFRRAFPDDPRGPKLTALMAPPAGLPAGGR